MRPHCHFQESWVANLPWAKAIVGEDGNMTQVCCIVCNKVEGQDKLLVAKIDSLWKHVGCKKVEKNLSLGRRKVNKGKFYFLLENMHVCNEKHWGTSRLGAGGCHGRGHSPNDNEDSKRFYDLLQHVM